MIIYIYIYTHKKINILFLNVCNVVFTKDIGVTFNV